jgi:hypothetical protein
LRRRHRRLRANNVGSARHSPHKLRRLHPPRRRHRRLLANGVSAPHNPHKLRRLHKLRRRHRRLRANNGSNVPSVRRKLRRLRLPPRLQSRLLPRQRLPQNRPIPITAKNRTATGKTIGPVRPDPIPNWVGECSSAALRLKLAKRAGGQDNEERILGVRRVGNDDCRCASGAAA